jgi:hypothetical protein
MLTILGPGTSNIPKFDMKIKIVKKKLKEKG